MEKMCKCLLEVVQNYTHNIKQNIFGIICKWDYGLQMKMWVDKEGLV